MILSRRFSVNRALPLGNRTKAKKKEKKKKDPCLPGQLWWDSTVIQVKNSGSG
jgi:hypothetical protein